MNTWLILNEAHFYMSGFVNNQNCRHCSKTWVTETCSLYTMFMIYFHTLACTCWFQLSYLIAQCTVIHIKNMHELYQHFLHISELTVLCAVSSYGVVWSLCLWECGVVYSEWLSVQSSTESHWKHTSSSAPFPVVPARWTNYSHSTDFHAYHQDIFPGRLISCFGTSPGPPSRLILR
jgi:hypothetical protein